MIPKELEVLRVERASANDDYVLLVRLAVADSAAVAEGDLLAELETSKAILEVRAPKAGFVFFRSSEGQTLAVGEIIAVIAPEPAFQFDQLEPEPATAPKPVLPSTTQPTAGPRLSKTAEELIVQHGLDVNVFAGKDLVTKADVLGYLQEHARKSGAPATPGWRRSESNQKILVLGGGGHARVCIEALRRMATFEIAGVAASEPEVGGQVLGIPVLARDTDIQDLYSRGFRFFVNGVGSVSNHLHRWRLYLKLKECGFYLPNLVHPSAAVDTSTRLGDGNQILAQAVVGSGAWIANNCIVNSGAVVSHDVVLYDNVHVSPGALLAGGVVVGNDTLIGMGAQVHLNIKIGSGVTIHNGCTVTRDVPDNAVVK